jgi:hypothetical protein
MSETTQLDWWIVKSDADFLVGRTSRFDGMGPGWERVVDLARDAAEHPHQTAPGDLLLLECREMADLLVQIVQEDGHNRTLAECLRAIIINTANRVGP